MSPDTNDQRPTTIFKRYTLYVIRYTLFVIARNEVTKQSHSLLPAGLIERKFTVFSIINRSEQK